MNRYVPFIPDDDFTECVLNVCGVYINLLKRDNPEEIFDNAIDPFKMVYDVYNTNIGLNDWFKTELVRQKDKSINNATGNFHQDLLGKVEGWVNLGVGDASKVDLKRDDGSIFMELKNKYNTMNSDSNDKCYDKLSELAGLYPNSICYWAYVIPKNGSSGETIWRKKGKSYNPRIIKAWGRRVYGIVTGDENNLYRTVKAIPLCIKDNKEELDIKLDNDDNFELIDKIFDFTFKREEDSTAFTQNSLFQYI